MPPIDFICHHLFCAWLISASEVLHCSLTFSQVCIWAHIHYIIELCTLATHCNYPLIVLIGQLGFRSNLKWFVLSNLFPDCHVPCTIPFFFKKNVVASTQFWEPLFTPISEDHIMVFQILFEFGKKIYIDFYVMWQLKFRFGE